MTTEILRGNVLLDAALGVLAQRESGREAVGIRPRAHASGATLGDNGVFHSLQDRGEIARHVGKLDAQSAGIAHQRRRKIGFDEEALALGDPLQQRLGFGVVGAEESGVGAILVKPLRNVLEDELLRAGHADVAGGIGSALEVILHPQIVAGGFHDLGATRHKLIAHVTGEGDMDEIGAAQLVGGEDDQIAAGDAVGVNDKIPGRGDDAGILVVLAGKQQDVGPGFADTAERLGRARDSLVDDDGLHQRIVGERSDLGDRRFLLGHEVVGVGDVLDHAAVGDVAVTFDQLFRAAKIVLGLRNRARADADVKLRRLRRHGGHGPRKQRRGQQSNNKLFHYLSPPHT